MSTYPSVTVHGVVVLVLTLFAIPFFFSGEGNGVDIGAVFLLLPLVVLGLPWSLPWLVVLSLDTSMTVLGILFVIFVLGGAAANVRLHHRWLQRRLRARALGVRP